MVYEMCTNSCTTLVLIDIAIASILLKRLTKVLTCNCDYHKLLSVTTHNIDGIYSCTVNAIITIPTHLFLYPLCFYLHVVIRCHVSKHALQVTVAKL